MSKKKIFIIGGIVLVVGIGAVLIFTGGETESPYSMTTVDRGDLEERVLATATVKAANEFELTFASGGRVDAVNVKVGDSVTKDQELARLDTAALAAQVRQRRAALSSAFANLNKVIAGASDASIAVAERAVDSAQIALNNANVNLEDSIRTAGEDLADTYADLLELFRDVELSAESTAQSLNSYFSITCNYTCLKTWGIFIVSPTYGTLLESSKAAIDSSLLSIQSLVAVTTSSTPQSAVDTNATSINSSMASILASLDTFYEGFQEDADKATIQALRLDVSSKLTLLDNQLQIIASVQSANITKASISQQAVNNAEAALSSARASLNQVLEPPRNVDLASLRAIVSQTQANLDAANAAFGDAIIKAPVDGTITQVNIQAGEISPLTGVAIGMVSGATYSVEANVPEADIAKIAVGNPVDIELDALPGQMFGGSVVSIDPAEEIIGGVVTFLVTTDIRDGVSKLKPGMTADLDILTTKKTGALFVPQRSVVRDKNGENSVRIVVNGELEFVPVETGIRSTGGILEIVSGVTEGQEIVNFINE